MSRKKIEASASKEEGRTAQKTNRKMGSPKRQQHLTGKIRQRKRRWIRKVDQKFSPKGQGIRIAILNLQRCKLQIDGRGRIQQILETIKENELNIVSETSPRDEGIWWYADDSVAIHSNSHKQLFCGTSGRRTAKFRVHGKGLPERQ